MGRISIPVDDLLRGQLHPEGIFKGEIVWATEKLASGGDSKNYEYSIQYSETADGRKVDQRDIVSRFNSKAMGYMNPFLAALAGKSIKDFAAEQKAKGPTIDFEWESVKGSKLQFKIETKPRNDNGQLKSEITAFYPYDYKVPF